MSEVVSSRSNDISGFLDPKGNPRVQITSDQKGALLLTKENFATFVEHKNSFFGTLSTPSPYSATVSKRQDFTLSALQPNTYSAEPSTDNDPYNVAVTTLRQKGSTTTSQTYYFLVTNTLDNIITEQGDLLITQLYPSILIEYYGTIKKSLEYTTNIFVRTS